MTIDEKFPTVAHVRWSGEGEGFVRYEDALGVLTTPSQPSVGGVHDVAVVGLAPGETTRLTAVTVGPGDAASTQAEVEVEVEGASPTLRIVAVTGASDGFVLTHGLTEDVAEAVVVIDGAGREVWRYPVAIGDRILTAELLPGAVVGFTSQPRDTEGGLVGTRHRVALDGSLDEAETFEGLHGGAVVSPDGIVHLSRAVDAWDKDQLLWDRVMERGADGTERLVFDFREVFAPVETCFHQRIVVRGQGFFDWTHANSLLISPDGDTVYVMSRHLDGLFAIDRRSGALLWVFGGPYGTLDRGTSPPFEHAHTSWFADGRLWLMDNGNHRGSSRVVGYDVDEEAGTAAAVAVYDEPDGAIVELLGDAKPTGRGDLVVSWSTRGRVDRLDPEGRSTWSVETALGVAPGRVTFLGDLYGR